MNATGRRGRGFAWGFLDQVFSSATNFGLSVLAGRLLGPGGLGVVAVGFSCCILAQSFQRALVTEPLVVASSSGDDSQRAHAARSALTVVLAGGVVTALGVGVAGLAVGGSVGRGLVLFAPWLVPVLIQDYWRAVLFRDTRGRAAAVNDGLWIVAMALTAPLAWKLDATWAVLASWGAGAAVSAGFGFVQARVRPARLPSAWRYWREDIWPFGRWLAAEGAVLAVGSQASVVILAAVLGTAALGGLKAAQTLFAPLSLLSSAASFPGLPALTR
jgi:O-antigen/teichoic acid export membrane protein